MTGDKCTPVFAVAAVNDERLVLGLRDELQRAADLFT